MRHALTLLILLAFPSVARARDAPWISPTLETIAFLTAFGILLVSAGFLAWRAYERGEIVLESTPTLPKYMTRRPAYYMGGFGFTVAAMLVYCIIVVFYRPFLPVVEFVSPSLFGLSERLEKEGKLAYPLVILFAGAVYVGLLGLESRFNPLLLLRDIFYRGAAIPKKVRELLYCAKTSIVTPQECRAAVLGDELVRFVDAVDFDKDWNTVDRKWADTSYLFHWLRLQDRSGKHATFFGERSLRWSSSGEEKGVKDRYLALADSVGAIKEQEANAAVLEFTNSELERVRTNMCRLVACFLVYKNSNEIDIWEEAANLGIRHGKVFVRNPLGRFVFFAVAFIVSAYLGSALSFATHQLIFGAAQADPLAELDTSIVNQWALYSLLINGIPVFVVLMLRYVTFRFDPPQPGVYPVTYVWSGVAGFVVGAVVLSLAVKLFEESYSQTSLVTLLAMNSQWAILPAVYCAFITWRMDMVQHLSGPAAEPPTARTWHAVWDRLKWGLPIAVLSALVVLIPALLIKEIDLPPAYSALGLGTMRWMIIGTAAVIGLAVGLVARPLHKAASNRYDKQPGVAGQPSPVGG